MKQGQPKSNIYQSARELPIHYYNEVIITQDFTHLVIDVDREYDEGYLALAWLNINNEFLEIIEDKESIISFKKKAEIMYLYLKLEVLLTISEFPTNYLQKEEVKKLLKSYKVRNLKTAIAVTQNKIAFISKELERGVSNEKWDFEGTLAMLNEAGYNINRKSTMLSEFGAILKRIKKRNVSTK